MNPHPDQIAAVILAGGRGQRMNGADKGLLLLHERPLVAHVYDSLRTQLSAIVVSANRNLGRYQAVLDVPLVTDAWPDYRGPLAGISAGFAATTRNWLLAVPADMPGLPDDLVAQFIAGCGNTPAAYAQIDGDAFYPLCLLHRSLQDDLRETLERGEYAVHRWLARHQAVAVPISGWPEGPRNLNTPELLASAEKHLT